MKRALIAVWSLTRELATRRPQSLEVTATVTSRTAWSARRSPERVLPRDNYFVQTQGNVSGTQGQTTAACSLWQKGRVEQPSRKWWTKRLRNTEWRVSGVSCEVANDGRQRTDGTRRGRSPSECGGRKGRAGKTFHLLGVSARGLGKTCLGKDQKNHCLGPAALIGPHVRNCWCGGRAYL